MTLFHTQNSYEKKNAEKGEKQGEKWSEKCFWAVKNWVQAETIRVQTGANERPVSFLY